MKIKTIFEVYKDKRAKTLNVLKTNELILSGDEQCFKITLSGVYAMDELSSNQEEADTKVTLHAYSILKNINPEKYIIIRSHSGDIDINIIATSLLVTYSANVYIDYGNPSSRKGIYLSELSEPNLTNSEKESLLGMHAFSGSDIKCQVSFVRVKSIAGKLYKLLMKSRRLKRLNYWESLKGVMTHY